MKMVVCIILSFICGSVVAGDYKVYRMYDRYGRFVMGYTEYNHPGRPIERSYFNRSGTRTGTIIGRNGPPTHSGGGFSGSSFPKAQPMPHFNASHK
jgi:hypothetical protein